MTTNLKAITGDGIIMAEEIGADFVDMDQLQLLHLGNPFTGSTKGVIPYKGRNSDEVIFVNAEGNRFVREDGRRDVMCNAITQQTGGYYWMIHDSQNIDPYADSVEEYIKGRELTCCVLDGKALPIVEIAPKEGFYDYKNKYQAGSTVEICPAPIGEENTRKIQKISERVFDALRLHKYARMDFMMDEAGNAYCLEANTLPGMTPTSLIPQEAAAVGISYDELCQKILDMAFED